MTINEAMGKFGLPSQTTSESLGLNWKIVLTFGDKVILTGYFFNGQSKHCYFGAVYEFLTDNTTCEGEIKLKSVSDVEFDDDGSAIAWALSQCSKHK